MKFHDQSILLNRSGSTHFILSVDRRCKVRPIQWPSQNLKQSKLHVQKIGSVADLIYMEAIQIHLRKMILIIIKLYM